MKKILLTVLVFLSFNVHSSDIEEVKVWNSNAELITILSNSKEISRFEELWSTKTQVILRAQPKWTNKIDINPGNRWLYSTRGYAQVLSKQAMVIYHIENVAQFNELLKTHNKSMQPTAAPAVD